MPRLFFIPGLSRCGTTWFSHWLSQHPDVAIVQETYLTRYLYSMINHKPESGRIVDRQHAIGFVTSVYTRAAAGRGCILDKSPGSFLYRGQSVEEILADFFPDSRCLLFYRDGKDYVHGFLNLPWKPENPHTVESAVADWKQNAEYLVTRKDRDTSMVIRYEDLIERPQEMSTKIASFLELSLPVSLAPWSTPINTVNTVLESQRWKSLVDSHGAVMRSMNPLLERLGYGPVL